MMPHSCHISVIIISHFQLVHLYIIALILHTLYCECLHIPAQNRSCFLCRHLHCKGAGRDK